MKNVFLVALSVMIVILIALNVYTYLDLQQKMSRFITESEVSQMMDQEMKRRDNAVPLSVAMVLSSIVIIEKGDTQGSGFFVDSRHVLTANHVVAGDDDDENKDKFTVRTIDDEKMEGRVVAASESMDLALLRVNPEHNIAPLALADDYRLGETVLVIGHPPGYEFSISKGIIGHKKRDSKETLPLIQFDAPINSGNSGGPVINKKGEVVGLVSQKVLRIKYQLVDEIGLAVRLQDIKEFLKENGISMEKRKGI